MVTVEIMFDDLIEEKQQEMLEAVGETSPDEMNWDTSPITTVEFDEFDEEGEIVASTNVKTYKVTKDAIVNVNGKRRNIHRGDVIEIVNEEGD